MKLPSCAILMAGTPPPDEPTRRILSNRSRNQTAGGVAGPRTGRGDSMGVGGAMRSKGMGVEPLWS